MNRFNVPRFSALSRRELATVVLCFVSLISPSVFAQSDAVELDFEYFKNEVQPIFLAKREGNVRCIQCHNRTSNLRLQPLVEHQEFWSDE